MDYNSNNKYYEPKKPNISPKKIKNIIVIAAIVIAGLMLISTCWYTVDDKQQAVVTTFGKVTGKTDAGIHFKLPFGIQKVDKVDVNVYQKIEIGYRTDVFNTSSFDVIETESKMITGDYNIVNVDFYVEYKISDPEKYLYNSYEPDFILKNLVQSQIRNVIGSSTVDDVLTTGKAEIQMRIKELVIEILEVYDIGLTLTDIKIQDSEPPTEEVIEAFKSVESAKQNAQTVINQARAYENEKLPHARAEADKYIQNAEYLKQARINEALQQVAMFEAMYTEYQLNPEITRIRMYYEMLQEALPGVRMYIDTNGSDSSTQMLLPLESFVNQQSGN